MLKRDFGKLSFHDAPGRDRRPPGRLDKKRLTETDWARHDLIDLGDQIVVAGPLGATKTGEVTVWGTKVRLAARPCFRRRPSGKGCRTSSCATASGTSTSGPTRR